MAKYKKPLDHDDQEKENNWKYRFPFALCKEKGIALPENATPRDAWNALKGIGINPDDEYENAIRERRKKYFQLQAKAKAKRKREEAKERKKQSYDPEHSPDYNYKHTPGTVAGVKKGQPMSFEKANGGAPNPYFNDKKYFGYSSNCQSCTVAFEARLRGYDVRALPNNRNPYIRDLSYMTNLAYINKNGKHPSYYRPMFREKTTDFFNRTIKEGERYNVEWGWKGKGNGHIICVEKNNGELKFYDPQSSAKMDIKKFKSRILPNADRSTMRVMRVDDCEFNPDIVNYVLKGVKK